MWRQGLAWGLALACLAAVPAWAAPTCFVLKITELGFEKKCLETLARKMAGEAYATFGDAFNINPASLPTEETPLGFEALISQKSDALEGSKYNLSLIRGFNDLGVGVSTNADNTFFSSSYVQRTSSSAGLTLAEESLLPTYNLGSAMALPLGAFLKRHLSPTVGAALRQGAHRSTKGYSLGASLSGNYWNLGLSYVHEPASNDLPQEHSYSLGAGLRLSRFFVDFSYVATDSSYGLANLYTEESSATTVATTLLLGRFALNYAWRRNTRPLYGVVEMQAMMGIHYQALEKLRLLYLYGYVAASHTLGAQVLLF
jgi:hypothetical protein